MAGAVLTMVGRTSAADVTPDALNWNNINGLADTEGNSQTIAGITTGITLRIVLSGGGINAGWVGYNKNSSGWINCPSLDFTLAMANGDTLKFKVQRGAAYGPSTVTITNSTDGGAAVDTFTVTELE